MKGRIARGNVGLRSGGAEKPGRGEAGGAPVTELPNYYFRIRENGAAVYRVETQPRNSRLEMTEIAAVNARNGSVKAHGNHELSPEDDAAIADWLAARQSVVAAREAEQGRACIEALNLTAQWAQSKADPEALEAVSDALLLAMHDLRAVLVRKKANRLSDKDERVQP